MKETIGERIKFHRIKNNYTLQQLADVIDRDKGSLSSYENGRYEPSAQVIISLSKCFDISTDELLTGTPYKSNFSIDEIDLLKQYALLTNKGKIEIKKIIKVKLEVDASDKDQDSKGKSPTSKGGKKNTKSSTGTA